MGVFTILFIISIIITSLAIYLVKNSHFYREEDPVKLPLGIWILLLLATCIPVINIIMCVIECVFLFNAYDENDLEFNEDFWLIKKY